MADELRPIIKKKVIVQGGGHHGGAWKVAYADFVTAMMAFFLLMWLLNATTEEQRKGLADYFNPTIPVHNTSGGGDGPFKGDSSNAELNMAQNGSGATNENPSSEDKADGMAEGGEEQSKAEQIAAIETMMESSSGESTVSDNLMQHIRTRVTDEGLVVELFDLPEKPLFQPGSDMPEARLVALLKMITEVFARTTNEVAIAGHLRAEPIRQAFYQGWEVSSDRALMVQQILVQAGLAGTRLNRVVGKADKSPMVEDVFDVRNERIELILLRSDLDGQGEPEIPGE